MQQKNSLSVLLRLFCGVLKWRLPHGAKGIRWGVHFAVRREQCAVWSVQCVSYALFSNQYAVWCLQYAVWCVQCVVCSLLSSVCSVQCAVYCLQCAVCSVQCTVFSVQWTVLKDHVYCALYYTLNSCTVLHSWHSRFSSCSQVLSSQILKHRQNFLHSRYCPTQLQ